MILVMANHGRFLGVASSILLCACTGGSPEAASAVRAISFEEDALDSVPRGFEIAETRGSGKPAIWRVVPGIDPDDPGQAVLVETVNTGSTFNLLLSTTEHAADAILSVYVIAREGKEDQGGGLAFRVRDADNYYVMRWNPLEDNLRLYKIVDGQRTMLASADTEARPQVWHRVWVSVRGTQMSVGLDADELIDHTDATFSGSGRFGLWTKADASTLFDLIEITDASAR